MWHKCEIIGKDSDKRLNLVLGSPICIKIIRFNLKFSGGETFYVVALHS